MLVATPGQTAAYHPTLHSSGGSAPKQICHTSSSSALTHTSAAAINKLPAESSSVSSSLMKSLSVRLNRGTEFLKGTVQKALISTSNKTAANTGGVHSSNIGHSAATSSGITFSSTTTKSLNTIGATTSRLAGAAAPSSALLKLYTVPPTVTHRYPEQRLQASSVDSLYKEMCHFKPIRSAPITPWKSGSKSRGASLKVPKAKLASKVNLHLNCNESAIWLGHDDDDVEDDEDEQEGENNDDNHGKPELDSVKHFRPKPGSTLLTNIISTPKHKSAFACLVAQMKNLATLPKSKMTIKPVELHKTKNSRGRTKYAATISSADVMTTTTPAGKNAPRKRMGLRNCRNPFVHVKKLHLPGELIISKSFRAIRQGKASKSTLQQLPKAGKGANSNNYNRSKSENHKTGITKAKSRAALKKAKSNVVNIVKLAQKNYSMSAVGGRKVVGKAVVTTTTATMQTSAAGETQRYVRKRKLINDLTELEPLTRKSARISKDCSSEATRTTMTTPTAAPMATGKACRGGSGTGSDAANSKKTMKKAGNRSDTLARFTPPLTRSRLKEMPHCKLLAALDYRHRII